jgi:cytochrome c-type biogenesis protein CcmF
MQYVATPMITVDSFGIHQYDDTVYAQNLFVQFAGVSEDQQRIKVGIKESDKMIDFVTLKAYIFPYINLVWIGLILMAIGMVMSMTNRIKISQQWRMFWLISIGLFLIYMFLFAN